MESGHHRMERKVRILLDIESICKSRGGCLLGDYTAYNKKLSLRCGKGHTWSTRYSVIKSGSWCPRCANRKSRCGNFTDKVDSLGGKVIGTYKRMTQSVLVACSKGHTFLIKPTDLLYKGRWCEDCLGIKYRRISNTNYRRRPYTKGPRCKRLTTVGTNKGKQCSMKLYSNGLCRYHLRNAH